MILKIIVWALLTIVYLPAFSWMKDRFLETGTNYSHGFLIPFVIGYMVFRKKEVLKNLTLAPSGWGLLCMAAALLAHLAALRLRIEFISAFSLLAAVVGAVLYLYGKDYLKTLCFPLCMYLFMVPLPTVFTVYITFNLKMLAAQIATSVLNLSGTHFIRQGSLIITPHAVLTVDDQCSGIRSLISLMTLGAIYAYCARLTIPKKILLFVFAVPFAIAANVVRIIVMVIASLAYGAQIINNGIFHTLTGLLVFLTAFGLLSTTRRICE